MDLIGRLDGSNENRPCDSNLLALIGDVLRMDEEEVGKLARRVLPETFCHLIVSSDAVVVKNCGPEEADESNYDLRADCPCELISNIGNNEQIRVKLCIVLSMSGGPGRK